LHSLVVAAEVADPTRRHRRRQRPAFHDDLACWPGLQPEGSLPFDWAVVPAIVSQINEQC
jgi:hypothetical protein